MLLLILEACSNNTEMETTEIRTLGEIKKVLDRRNTDTVFIDSRNLLSRNQIDAAATPVLFIELKTGQNGTLTPYPGKGIGQTWLGADGATVTFERGVLKATRGMGDDIMGGLSFIPEFSKIKKTSNYERKLSYLDGNNNLFVIELNCQIRKSSTQNVIDVWGVPFKVRLYKEKCTNPNRIIKNSYYVDQSNNVRRSIQFHSDTIGYILIERLDRLK